MEKENVIEDIKNSKQFKRVKRSTKEIEKMIITLSEEIAKAKDDFIKKKLQNIEADLALNSLYQQRYRLKLCLDVKKAFDEHEQKKE